MVCRNVKIRKTTNPFLVNVQEQILVREYTICIFRPRIDIDEGYSTFPEAPALILRIVIWCYDCLLQIINSNLKPYNCFKNLELCKQIIIKYE